MRETPRSISEPALTEAIAAEAFLPAVARVLAGTWDAVDASPSVLKVQPFHTGHGFGETDLFIEMEKVALFIEIKISAGFQDAQAQRYLQRRDQWCARCRKLGRTLLLAPGNYLRDKPQWTSQFDDCVPLEALRGVVARDSPLSSLLTQALEAYADGFQGAKGNHPVLHDALHRELARRDSPLRPSPVAHTGDWVHLHSPMPGIATDYRVSSGVFVVKAAKGLPCPPEGVFDFLKKQNIRGSAITVPHSFMEVEVSAAGLGGEPTEVDITRIVDAIGRVYDRVERRYRRATGQG